MEARMKTLALTTLLTLAIGAYTPARSQGPYDKRADAHKDIQTALTEAQADGKLVLLDFGANWCLDCIVLSHLYEDETRSEERRVGKECRARGWACDQE